MQIGTFFCYQPIKIIWISFRSIDGSISFFVDLFRLKLALARTLHGPISLKHRKKIYWINKLYTPAYWDIWAVFCLMKQAKSFIHHQMLSHYTRECIRSRRWTIHKWMGEMSQYGCYKNESLILKEQIIFLKMPAIIACFFLKCYATFLAQFEKKKKSQIRDRF